MIGNEIMEGLERAVGQNVTIQYAWSGEQKQDQGILRTVRPYHEIGFEQDSGRKVPLEIYISFVGSNRAVKEIIGEDGEILYENPLIQPILHGASSPLPF